MSKKQEYANLVRDCGKLVKALIPNPDNRGIVWKLPHQRAVARAFAKLLSKYAILQEIYMTLIIHAIRREIVTYGDLAREINQRLGEKVIPTKGSWLGKSLGEILGIISLYEWSVGRPFLSVLVVRTDTRVPGEGFENLVRSFGLKVNVRCEQERCFVAWGSFAWRKAR